VLLGVINVIDRFIVDGKLPQPFIFDINDTFMDWFNTAYWAHNRGAFDVWHTVYPPLAFVFLRLFGIGTCYRSDAIAARDCDWIGIVTILVSYCLCALVAYLAFRRRDRRTAIIRGLAFALGLPLLFTLERGNLILVAFIFFALAHGELLTSRLVRAFAVAISINFKPYLLLPALASAFRRDWRKLELAGIATLGVYLITFAAYGAGTLTELKDNAATWLQLTGTLLWEQVYYSTSYAPFLGFDTYRFPARDFVPSGIVDWMSFAIPILIHTTQLLALLSLAGAWVQPRALEVTRISTILLGTYLVGQSPGGYTLTFLLFLVFLEPWRRVGPAIALTMAYLLSIPYDHVISMIITLTGDSWLSGRVVETPFGISLGIFIRPGLVVIMMWALMADSIALVVAAHRETRPTFRLLPWSDPKGAESVL